MVFTEYTNKKANSSLSVYIIPDSLTIQWSEYPFQEKQFLTNGL